MAGFEPATAGFVDRCSIQLSYTRWGETPNIANKRSNGLFFTHSTPLRLHSSWMPAARTRNSTCAAVRMASGTSSWHCSKCIKHSKADMSPSRYESSKCVARPKSSPAPNNIGDDSSAPGLAKGGAVQPQSMAETSPRIMQIRFMVLRPFAGNPADSPHRSNHQLTSSSIVTPRSTTLANVTT